MVLLHKSDGNSCVVCDAERWCLSGMQLLCVHASSAAQHDLHSSPAVAACLQPDHLDALATGSQLQSLSLCVYQTGLGGSSRVQLNPLLALTNLRNLEMAYRGECSSCFPTVHFCCLLQACSSVSSVLLCMCCKETHVVMLCMRVSGYLMCKAGSKKQRRRCIWRCGAAYSHHRAPAAHTVSLFSCALRF